MQNQTGINRFLWSLNNSPPHTSEPLSSPPSIVTPKRDIGVDSAEIQLLDINVKGRTSVSSALFEVLHISRGMELL